MAKNLYTDLKFNGAETQDVSYEKLASDPVAPFNGQYWFNTTSKVLKHYDGTVTRIVASQAWVTTEINKLQQAQGQFDASGGLLPTAANKINGDLTTVVAGDYWFISLAGTIAGIAGADLLSVGDKIQYMGGGVATAANWVGVQTNLDDTKIGDAKNELQTDNLVANVPKVFTASTISTVYQVTVCNSADEEIMLDMTMTGNTVTLTSKKSLTGVKVYMTGIIV